MNTAGNGEQIIIEDPGAHFFGLGVDQTYDIYFSDWNIEFSSLRLSKIKIKKQYSFALCVPDKDLCRKTLLVIKFIMF